jgi:hypothetical protein
VPREGILPEIPASFTFSFAWSRTPGASGHIPVHFNLVLVVLKSSVQLRRDASAPFFLFVSFLHLMAL